MTLEQIRAAKQTHPFRPFIIHLDDGRTYEVRHPDFLALSSNERAATFFDDEGGRHLLDLEHINEVYIPPIKASA